MNSPHSPGDEISEQDNYVPDNEPEIKNAPDKERSLVSWTRTVLAVVFLAVASGSAGCASVQRGFKRLLGPSQSDALTAISNRNFPLAGEYYDDIYCEEVAEHLERCEEGTETNGCQITENTMNRCEQVNEGTSNTIDSFKEKILENVAKHRYDEAIKYTDSIRSMLEENDELYQELTEKRAEYVKRIKLAEKRYPETVPKIGTMVMKVDIDPKAEFKESDWDELRQLIEQARIDREIIAELDETLFIHVVELTKRVSKRGDLKKAGLAVKMCEAVDLGSTNFETTTQATEENKALFGAITGEINQQKADRKEKILEIMNALYPIEKRLDDFFAAKKRSEKRREIAKEIVDRANEVYENNKDFINSIEALRQRVRTIYLQLDPKTRRRPKRGKRPRVVVPPPVVPPPDVETPELEKDKLSAAGAKELARLTKLYKAGNKFRAISGLEAAIAKFGTKLELMSQRAGWDDERRRLIEHHLETAYTLKGDEDFSAIEHFRRALKLNPDNIDERHEAKKDMETMVRRKKKFEGL